eukprot:TRINITY_DN7925_c0_g1_i6.p1 TRINITY_DN7925_c0_g1~~TRINITY_DN7925_c0_g1_i6.p1  ORF type:complete len:376 (-),score=71.84 TRINITY_DN7925_c0_g1_i6:276-1403(-)
MCIRDRGCTITKLVQMGGNMDTVTWHGTRKLQYGVTAEFKWKVVSEDGETSTGSATWSEEIVDMRHEDDCVVKIISGPGKHGKTMFKHVERRCLGLLSDMLVRLQQKFLRPNTETAHAPAATSPSPSVVAPTIVTAPSENSAPKQRNASVLAEVLGCSQGIKREMSVTLSQMVPTHPGVAGVLFTSAPCVQLVEALAKLEAPVGSPNPFHLVQVVCSPTSSEGPTKQEYRDAVQPCCTAIRRTDCPQAVRNLERKLEDGSWLGDSIDEFPRLILISAETGKILNSSALERVLTEGTDGYPWAHKSADSGWMLAAAVAAGFVTVAAGWAWLSSRSSSTPGHVDVAVPASVSQSLDPHLVSRYTNMINSGASAGLPG